MPGAFFLSSAAAVIINLTYNLIGRKLSEYLLSLTFTRGIDYYDICVCSIKTKPFYRNQRQVRRA
jgi:hypothetical protein